MIVRLLIILLCCAQAAINAAASGPIPGGLRRAPAARRLPVSSIDDVKDTVSLRNDLSVELHLNTQRQPYIVVGRASALSGSIGRPLPESAQVLAEGSDGSDLSDLSAVEPLDGEGLDRAVSPGSDCTTIKPGATVVLVEAFWEQVVQLVFFKGSARFHIDLTDALRAFVDIKEGLRFYCEPGQTGGITLANGERLIELAFSGSPAHAEDLGTGTAYSGDLGYLDDDAT